MRLSITELNNLTGLDRRRIRAALVDLESTQGKKGALLFESREALPLLYMYPGEGENLDLTQERARLAHHQANKAALEERKLKGELIEVEEVAEIVGKDYGNVRAKLLAIPHKAAPRVAIESDTAALAAMLGDYVNEALAELSADAVYSAD